MKTKDVFKTSSSRRMFAGIVQLLYFTELCFVLQFLINDEQLVVSNINYLKKFKTHNVMRKKEFHIIDQRLIIGSIEVNTTMKQITICICHDFQEQIMKRI